MEGLAGRAAGEEFMTDYLCIGFPPVRSVCKLTLTFPNPFIAHNYLVAQLIWEGSISELFFFKLLLIPSTQRFQRVLYHDGDV